MDITDFTGPQRASGDNILYMNCPVCGCQRWKTYVNPNTGGWFCHAAEHGGGGVLDVGLPLRGRWSTFTGQRRMSAHVLPEMVLPAWQPLSPAAYEYLSRRGIHSEQATRLNIVEMEEQRRVLVPFHAKNGSIVYWTARKYCDQEVGPKYLSAPGKRPLYWLWPDSNAGSDAQFLVVVEGVFDAISVHQNLGLPVVGLGGKFLPEYLKQDFGISCNSKSVVVMLDNDALGAAMKIKRTLVPRHHVIIISLPPGEDPSSMGVKLKDVFYEHT